MNAYRLPEGNDHRRKIVFPSRAPPWQVLSVSTSKEDGEYGEGEEIAFTVVYNHDMDVLGTPTLPLNSGGVASFTLGGRRQVGYE